MRKMNKHKWWLAMLWIIQKNTLNMIKVYTEHSNSMYWYYWTRQKYVLILLNTTKVCTDTTEHDKSMYWYYWTQQRYVLILLNTTKVCTDTTEHDKSMYWYYWTRQNYVLNTKQACHRCLGALRCTVDKLFTNEKKVVVPVCAPETWQIYAHSIAFTAWDTSPWGIYSICETSYLSTE